MKHFRGLGCDICKKSNLIAFLTQIPYSLNSIWVRFILETECAIKINQERLGTRCCHTILNILCKRSSAILPEQAAQPLAR